MVQFLFNLAASQDASTAHSSRKSGGTILALLGDGGGGWTDVDLSRGKKCVQLQNVVIFNDL